jgi:hypothetical protein
MTTINRVSLPLAALVFQCTIVNVSAQATVNWIRAMNGGIPPEASSQGRDEDGRAQYVCRARYGKGLHIGKIASGFTGCNIGFGGREITVATYEVMSLSIRKLAAEASGSKFSSPAMLKAGSKLSPAIAPSAITGSSNTGVAMTRQRGMDEEGQPYIEEQLPDGTIKRTKQNGVQVIKPDGTKQFTPFQSVRANVQPPTPPALPADRQLGRAWVEYHNANLLDVIRRLVYEDAAAMNRFSEKERQAVGNDLFKQIAYRTEIAEFLAQSR